MGMKIERMEVSPDAEETRQTVFLSVLPSWANGMQSLMSKCPVGKRKWLVGKYPVGKRKWLVGKYPVGKCPSSNVYINAVSLKLEKSCMGCLVRMSYLEFAHVYIPPSSSGRLAEPSN